MRLSKRQLALIQATEEATADLMVRARSFAKAHESSAPSDLLALLEAARKYADAIHELRIEG